MQERAKPRSHQGRRHENLESAVEPTTVLAEESNLPQAYTLHQNYPNPFNASTLITYQLPRSSEVTLTIYNLTGQKVATLVEGVREGGTFSIRWDGRDDRGHDLATGVYLYRLLAGTQVETRKLVLVR